MNKKLRKAVSIIALVFMGLFTVSLVLCLIDINMLPNGGIGFIALFTGFLGISLFFVLYVNDRAERRNEQARKRHDLTDADKTEETGGEKAELTVSEGDGKREESLDEGEKQDKL